MLPWAQITFQITAVNFFFFFKAYASRILRAKPTELVQCGRLAWHRTRIERVQYSINAFTCLHFILKNHAKSKLDSNIVAVWGVIEANYKSR